MIPHYLLNLQKDKKWSRRDFLKSVSAATLATMLSADPAISFASRRLFAPKAEQVILLWMAGGMAHTETFDPKKPSPFRNGLPSYHVRSTFPSIPTVMDGVHFSEGLEEMAKIMDRMTLVRSFMPPDLGHILHSRHQFHWHTGYIPPQTIEMPHIGSVVSKMRGPLADDIPSFVHIGQRLDIDGSPEVKAFLTPGFLGSDHAPLSIPYPERAKADTQPPPGVTPGRFDNRYAFYKKLLARSPVGEFGSDFQRDSLLKSMEDSYRLLSSPKVRAFNIYEENEKVLAKYNTGRFGLGCLLARRLVEQGVRFVEVTTEHVPFGNWDTHNNGHTRTVEMKKWIDSPVSQLVRDLEERGMLDKTLIILASEFSRSAIKDGSTVVKGDPGFLIRKENQYGLHRHFARAGSVLLIGGGAKRGMVYGRSSDEPPCETIENPVSLADLHATIYHLLGIPADTSFEIEKRPVYVTDNAVGKAIHDLIA